MQSRSLRAQYIKHINQISNVTYPINAVVKLAPGPDRVRITDGLTV